MIDYYSLKKKQQVIHISFSQPNFMRHDIKYFFEIANIADPLRRFKNLNFEK